MEQETKERPWLQALVKDLSSGMLANLSTSDDEIIRNDLERFKRDSHFKPLQLDEEKEGSATKVRPSPFCPSGRCGVRHKSLIPRVRHKSLLFRTKDAESFAGQPCSVKPGITPEKTGCTPASGQGKQNKPKEPVQAPGESTRIVPVKRRAEKGKLVPASREGKGKDAKVVMADGSPAPPHITPAMIPPAWSRVKVSLSPDADVLVSGKMKGKDGQWHNKTVYNAKYMENNSAAKFAKIVAGLELFQGMQDQNQNNRSNPELKNAADCLWLMMEQATRPGSESDTKGLAELYGKPVTPDDVLIEEKKGKKSGKVTLSVVLKVGDKKVPIRDDGLKRELKRRVDAGKELPDSGYWLKSHGATTLEGRHIVKTPEGVKLQFVGKETVWHDHLVRNPELAKILLERKKAAGETGSLFGIDYGQAAKYSHTLDGGKFGLKDFRTLRATKTAIEEIKKLRPPSAEGYKTAVMGVAETVSGILGNRPAQALESYIAPEVFSQWFDPQTDDNSIDTKSLGIKVKSSPFLTKSWLKKDAGQQPKNVRGQPCPPGYTPERDGCIASEDETGQKQSSQGQQQQAPQQTPETVGQAVDQLVGEQETQEQPDQNAIGLDSAEDVFGMSDGAIVKLLGIPSGGKVKDKFNHKMEHGLRGSPQNGAEGIMVEIEHPKLVNCERFMGIDADGEKFIHNELLEVKKEFRKSGIGSQLFADEVKNAAAKGFKYIHTEAAGYPGHTMNGYYTWPRLGYDETLESLNRYKPALVEDIRNEFPGADSVLDVFDMEGGREWWKENGDSLRNAKFDLAEGSRSRQVLDDYMKTKAPMKKA